MQLRAFKLLVAAAASASGAKWRDDSGNDCSSDVLTASWCANYGAEQFEQKDGSMQSACEAGCEACDGYCDDASCEDSSSWYYKKESKDCDWVAKKAKKRCEKSGADVACAETCGACDEEDDDCPADDASWYYKKSKKNCGWTKGKAKRCAKEGLGDRTGYEACPTSCGCETPEPTSSTPRPTLAPHGGGADLASPEGPSQQCADDAGPPWADDAETYPNARYHDDTPATPSLLEDGACAAPLSAACEAKGARAAYLDGPVDCGGAGWFCRIMPQDGWTSRGTLGGDLNFDHCNETANDDLTGHCHGSTDDATYGWWIRDHWFRGYAGSLFCCCDWERTKGVVSRCDYRMPVTDVGDGGAYDLETCRDANEDHGYGYEGRCKSKYEPFDDPLDSTDQCWALTSFADV